MRVGLRAIVLLATGLTTCTVFPVNGAEAQTKPLRVMTYNINHGGLGSCPEPPDPVVDCSTLKVLLIADIIREYAPDVVGLQEVDRFWARSGLVDQPALLAQQLGMSQCFGANLKHGPDSHSPLPHEYGTAILSKYPLENCTNTLLPKADPRTEQRGLLRADVIVGAARLPVYTTHLQNCTPDIPDPCGPGNPDRTAQTQAIANTIDPSTKTVLTGDFNARPGWPELSPITSKFKDVWPVGQGPGYTYPAQPIGDATRRIDYVFVRRIKVISATLPVTVKTRNASDHYPVLADLKNP